MSFSRLPRVWRRLVAGAVVAVALGASLVAIRQASAGTLTPAAPDDRLALLQQLRDLAAAHPDQYAGLSTAGDGQVVLHLAGPGTTVGPDAPAVLDAARGAGISVTVDHRGHSLAELTRIQDAIPNAGPFAALPTGELVTWGVDPDTDSVRVGVAHPTSALLDQARAAYGDAVTVVAKSPATAVYGRTTDTPNFYGGDWITAADGNQCSSGFTLTNFYGVNFMMTAGHCWGLGTAISTNGLTLGTVDFRRHGGGGLDAELIGGATYAGRIWVGAVNTNTSSPVHSARNSCTGCQVYFDGAVTGQSLATLYGGTSCWNVSGVVECGLQEAVGAHQICWYGDSGGPVFAYDGKGGVIAVGIITAVIADSEGIDCLYTPVPSILSTWQSTITTA